LLQERKFGDAASAAWKNISPTEIQKAGTGEALKAYKVAYDQAISSGIDTAGAASLGKEAYQAALPGFMAKYGPISAVGLGAAYLGGAFKPIPAEPPANAEMFNVTSDELRARNPEKYALNFGGVRTSYAPNPYDSMYSAYKTVPAPVALAKGGIASLEDFPRKTGPISGPGTGTSDSVPAMLSDGEFVFTAKAVRAMGQGSRRKGAKRMYALMKQLEKRGK